MMASVDESARTQARSPVLSDLLEKVEAATDRLDNGTLGQMLCAIERKTFGGSWVGCGDDGSDELTINDRRGVTVWGGYRCRAPDVSLDAALALVERVLPGWAWTVSGPDLLGAQTTSYACIADKEDNGAFEPWNVDRAVADARAATPPLALCAALLRALIEHGQNGTSEPMGKAPGGTQ